MLQRRTGCSPTPLLSATTRHKDLPHDYTQGPDCRPVQAVGHSDHPLGEAGAPSPLHYNHVHARPPTPTATPQPLGVRCGTAVA
jgi:hypothetical protein